MRLLRLSSVVAALLASLLLAGIAHASPLWPPTRYQGDATVRVHYLQPLEILDICAIVRKHSDDACSIGGELFIPTEKGEPDVTKIEAFAGAANPCRGHTYRDGLICHELGHSNGWPADHPQ